MEKLQTRKRNAIRTTVLFAFSVLVLLGAAAPAGAASVGLYWWSAYYVAAPGEANNLTVSETPGYYVFSDPNANLTAQNGCTVTDIHHATCPSKYVRSLYVKTGDSNDTISFQPTLIPATIDCGTGIDTLNTPDPNARPTDCEYVNPPPVTPPAVTPPSPLSIVQTAATMTRKGSVPLTVNCSPAAITRCTGTITFVLPSRPKKGHASASRRGAPNILGHQHLTVDRGKRRKVTISMTGKGRTMVKRRKKLKVTAKLVIKQGGKTSTSTQSLTINAPRGA